MLEQICVNGVEICYEQTGESGDPLVMVHGSLVDHHNWGRVAPLLARSFRVVTYDRRGHSRSERPAVPDTIHDDVADLAALIEELDLAPAHVAGSSFGGSIALRLAAERPDLVCRLVVNEPPLLGLLASDPQGQAMFQAIEEQFSAIGALLEAGQMEAGVRRFAEDVVFGPDAWAHLPAELKQTVIYNAPTFLAEMHDPDAFRIDPGQLRSFPRTVLVTCGENSPPFLPWIASRVAEALPRGELYRFAGANHEAEQAQPEQYVATVEAFLTRVAATE